ncbi:PREDICTED: syntaxin-8 isoform X3 [Cercocebus atys]|uniref:syntaxin-8 isoform X3 n=1 Tax=Cercocebus atys TaxID=9531 RepID=UPI0005F40492|nr:PREDICTED: syntaxin-8 isoform X3 [Cercocebus atys]XP_011906426.1 PREDICTED: syntaxin-8 isoform X3 [Cercocebus atys]
MKEKVKRHRRSSLMSEEAKRGAPNPWLFEEPEETRGLGFDEIRQQQQKIIQEQDAGLDALSSIINRQKQMGQEIGNELDEQNEIIDDLANLVENTDEKLRTETRRVNLVDRKSTSCENQKIRQCREEKSTTSTEQKEIQGKAGRNKELKTELCTFLAILLKSEMGIQPLRQYVDLQFSSSSKDQTVNTLGIEDHTVAVATIHLCHFMYGLKTAIHNRCTCQMGMAD